MRFLTIESEPARNAESKCQQRSSCPCSSGPKLNHFGTITERPLAIIIFLRAVRVNWHPKGRPTLIDWTFVEPMLTPCIGPAVSASPCWHPVAAFHLLMLVFLLLALAKFEAIIWAPHLTIHLEIGWIWLDANIEWQPKAQFFVIFSQSETAPHWHQIIAKPSI